MAARGGNADFEALDGLLRDAVLAGGGADDEGAIGDGFGDGGTDAGGLEDVRAADGGDGFTEGDIVGIDEAEIGKPEVRDGAGGRPDVERVAGGDENNGWFAADNLSMARRLRRARVCEW